MKIRIYQINLERDIMRVAFSSYDQLEEMTGSPVTIDSSIYDLVYEGEVDCQDLEDVFQVFNLHHPSDHRGRSLSVSDIVEVIEVETDADNDCSHGHPEAGFYYCNSFGFKKVSFGSPQEDKRIRVVLLEPRKLARTVEIGANLAAMQAVVGGNIEALYPFGETVSIICNEEGKINDLTLNRAVYRDAAWKEMTYSEMAARFREAERHGKHLDGLITFSEDSFTKPYSLEARTYMVSSQNKAFQPNMGGYSIFGSALDGSDSYVRLEQYMAAEKGGKDGWKIERCCIREGSDEILDIIAGTFFICDCSGQNFGSLSEEQAVRYTAMFRLPEVFSKTGDTISAISYVPYKSLMLE